MLRSIAWLLIGASLMLFLITWSKNREDKRIQNIRDRQCRFVFGVPEYKSKETLQLIAGEKCPEHDQCEFHSVWRGGYWVDYTIICEP